MITLVTGCLFMVFCYDWSEWVCDLGNDEDVYFTTFKWLDVSEIRVTWGKAPPFGDDLSLTYLFASTSEKSYMYVTNYICYVFDRISYSQWQHVSRNSTFNSRSQNVAHFVMWGKAPRGPMIPHNYSKWIIIVNFNSRHDCILYHVCVSDCS